MPNYLHGINLQSVSLGLNSGKNVTTGQGNTLLGANAGSDLTTGSNNTIVGGYKATAEADSSNQVILANGSGNPVCRWDDQGTMQFGVATMATVTDPTADNTVRVAFDPATNAIVHKVRYGGTTYVSRGLTQDSVNALTNTTVKNSTNLGGVPAAQYALKSDTTLKTTSTGTSLISNPATLTLRGLSVQSGTGLSLDATTNPDVLTLAGTVPTLTDETNNVPAGTSRSLVGSTSGGSTLRTKQLVQGAGIKLTSTGSTVLIENTATSGDAVTLQNVGPSGSTSLVASGLGPSLQLRGLIAGTGVTLSTNTSDQSVTVAGNVATLTSEAGGSSLVSVDNVPSALRMKALLAGSGITLTDQNGGRGVRVDNAMTLESAGGTVPLAHSSTGSTLAIKGLKPGFEIGIADDGNGGVTVRSNVRLPLPIRPADVTVTSGQLVVLPAGYNITPPQAGLLMPQCCP